MMAKGKGQTFLKHLHPPMIRERTLQPLATLGLGIVCLTCLIVLAATGLTLFLYYVPYHEVAYDRILHIMTTLRYGKLIRNLHYLAANVLIIAGLIHLARVFLPGVTGVASLTGYTGCCSYPLSLPATIRVTSCLGTRHHTGPSKWAPASPRTSRSSGHRSSGFSWGARRSAMRLSSVRLHCT